MEVTPRMNSSAGLLRDASLSSYIQAVEVEQGVRERFALIEKGRVLKTILTILPIATTLVGIVGGLFTVYASSAECQNNNFKTYCRMLLYTSLSYTFANIVMDKSLGACTMWLMRHPGLAFPLFCGQALVVGGFFLAMAVLLGLVIRSSCPQVTSSIRSRLAF